MKSLVNAFCHFTVQHLQSKFCEINKIRQKLNRVLPFDWPFLGLTGEDLKQHHKGRFIRGVQALVVTGRFGMGQKYVSKLTQDASLDGVFWFSRGVLQNDDWGGKGLKWANLKFIVKVPPQVLQLLVRE